MQEVLLGYVMINKEEMEIELELEYQVSREEFIDFNLKYYKKPGLYFAWILLLDLFSILYFVLFVTSAHSKTYTFIGVAILLMVFILCPFIVSYTYKKNINKLYSLKVFDNYFLKTTMKMNKDGIKISTKLCETLLKWDAFDNLHLVHNNIYIDTFMHDFIFIGVHDIDEKTRIEFLETIENHTNLKPKYTMPNIVYS